jgi:hypothetical protein
MTSNLNTDKINSILNNIEHSNSDKYKLFSTERAVKPFLEQGFTMSKFQGKGAMSAHIVRLRHDSLKIGEDFIEVVLTNSYDGTTCFKVNLGIFRLVCSNGMVVGKSLFNRSVKHIGESFYFDVNAAINDALNNVESVKTSILKLQNTQLNDEQIFNLASKVFTERLSTVKNLTMIDLYGALKPTRLGDSGKDAYTILNIIQERCLRGGIQYETMKATDIKGRIENEVKRNTTRSVCNVQNTLKLNQMVFDEALKLVA